MQVQSVHPDGILDVLFTEQTSKTQYLMTGTYDPESLKFDLNFAGDYTHNKASGWTPCDAVGVISKDLSTLTGDAFCTKNGKRQKCEFAGGGDKSVNGVYTSVPKNHDLFYSETFQGVPIYKQVSCENTDAANQGAPCMMDNVIAQTRIGNQKYWVLTTMNSLQDHYDHKDDILKFEEQDSEPASVFDHIKYSSWSEEVTPPTYAWRSRGHFQSLHPAPTVEAVVSSMAELQAMAHPLAGKVKEEENLGGGLREAGNGKPGMVVVLLVVGIAMVVAKVFGGKKKYGGVGGGNPSYMSPKFQKV
jgi:hypothetical protein